MKFSQLGQLALASAVSAALVFGITACGQSNTVDFIFVSSANSNPGSIYAFSSDGESGALSPVQGSPFPAGRNPIAMTTSQNGLFLYALNHDDNTVIEYSVGTDGKLYPQNTYNIKSGTNPNGMTISPDGNTLYVVEAYGLDPNSNPYSPTTPGTGALVQFPIDNTPGTTQGSLGAETAYATCNNPVAVAATAAVKLSDNSTTYSVYVVNDPAGQVTTLIDTVAAQNRGATGSATVTYPATAQCSGGTNATGQITYYNLNAGGALVQGDAPIAAGVAPVAITTDPTNRFAYVLDYQQNTIYGYSIQNGGALVPLKTPTTVTGQLPSAITIDPRGKYMYVANFNASPSVSGYTLDAVTGVLSATAGSGSASTDTGPASVLVEPSIGRYIYTGNFVAGTVSGLTLDPNQGTTGQVQNTPFLGPAKATALAAVKHGDHAVQINPVY